MPYLSREALAWAAGFFDGEGSVHQTYKWVRPNGTPGSQIQISISQSGVPGLEVLKKFEESIGIPVKLYGPYGPAKNQRLVQNMLEINGFEKVQAVMAMLWPWLGSVKKAQFQRVLTTYRSHWQPRRS